MEANFARSEQPHNTTREVLDVAHVAITGASGRAGRATVAALAEAGHEVVAIDLVRPSADAGFHVVTADVRDFGQTIDALSGCDIVVHHANIPMPGLRPDVVTLTDNTAMNTNVFMAAAKLGMRKVVWASSETTLGLPFDTPPTYLPIDEEHYPRPTSTYALSKVLGETTARHIADWSGIPFVALRFSNILGPAEYPLFPTFWEDPNLRKVNLWGYIDERDVGTVCRLAVEADCDGARSYVIAAADTVMNVPSRELAATCFPGVPVRGDLAGFDSLLSTAAARADLGYVAAHTWRDHVDDAKRP